MTASSPAPGPVPKRLSFLTVPLLISLLYAAISLLALPFLGPRVQEMLPELQAQMGLPADALPASLIPATLWISFALTALEILLLYYTRRAVLEGRAWGRVSSLIIAVLSLLIFPLGTLLGIVMLIGAFDREVVAYTQR
ncbi:hypothetical protein [Deinococcus multiflagellatus]|uniref:DUF4234 domain-containing protein n=1 Tax=Deinococcus multiflagellatus TaxID=1656887 RepID=A0ABW1ZNH3_9DEIO|nr:hypothetical protein [Deinococcus multiflagellatus]MBZ9713980.1 hypothetical protein [Deinococcus multiflagellatus]